MHAARLQSRGRRRRRTSAPRLQTVSYQYHHQRLDDAENGRALAVRTRAWHEGTQLHLLFLGDRSTKESFGFRDGSGKRRRRLYLQAARFSRVQESVEGCRKNARTHRQSELRPLSIKEVHAMRK